MSISEFGLSLDWPTVVAMLLLVCSGLIGVTVWWLRRRQREIFPVARGETLDRFAELYGLQREKGERDKALRQRILGVHMRGMRDAIGLGVRTKFPHVIRGARMTEHRFDLDATKREETKQ